MRSEGEHRRQFALGVGPQRQWRERGGTGIGTIRIHVVVVVYLRLVTPIKQQIAENPGPAGETLPSDVIQRSYGGNYGTAQ